VKLEIEQAEVDERGGVCNWYIRFYEHDGPEIMSDLLVVRERITFGISLMISLMIEHYL
jgi:hypothetical protein